MKNKSKHIKKVLIIPILFLAVIWLVPIHIGWYKEMPYCIFRFQVFEYQQHDYGETTWQGIFIQLHPKKYGTYVFLKKIGGVKAYFGIEDLPYELSKECCGWEK